MRSRGGGARPRYYFRRDGRRIPLPGLPGSDEFMEAYRAALTMQLPRPMIGASRTKAGSISALIVSYLSSSEFRARPKSTQRTYYNILERFRREHGDKPVALLTKKHIDAMLAQKVKTPAAANHWLRLVKVLMQLAVEEGYRPDNPATNIKRIKNRTDGFLYLGRGCDRRLRGEASDRQQGAAGAGLTALHGAAPLRRRRHGPPACSR